MNPRTGWIVLAISLLLVGGRTLVAAQSALRLDSGHGRSPLNRRQDTLVFDATRSDSLIKSTSVSVRNPFVAPPPRAVPVTPARKQNQPTPMAPVAPPRVNLFMQDGNSTVVQIEVNGESSDRMTVGSTFRGWKIVGITDRGIQVTNGNATFNLPLPRN